MESPTLNGGGERRTGISLLPTVRTRTGPAVRTASLLEQREFEPPVLFGFSSPEKEAKSGRCRRFC